MVVKTARLPERVALRLLLLMPLVSLQPVLADTFQAALPEMPWRQMVDECKIDLLKARRDQYARCMRKSIFEELGLQAGISADYHEENVESENGNWRVPVLSVSWKAATFFDVDEHELTEAAMPTIRLLSQALHLDIGGDVYVHLIGHTDSDGSREYNQALSERRAEHVLNLLHRLGAPATEMFYWGMGELQPVADNNKASRKARNRRVEIVLSAEPGANLRAVRERERRVYFIKPDPGERPAREIALGIRDPAAVVPLSEPKIYVPIELDKGRETHSPIEINPEVRGNKP